MKTYKVTTYGIYSSHMAEAGQQPNSAYDTSKAKVQTHAVWWLWPTTCLMRYPGRSSMIVLNIIPMGPDRTLETYDFFLETSEPDETEKAAIHYLDTVLQVEDIALVESVQRGMNTPAFQQGRIWTIQAGQENPSMRCIISTASFSVPMHARPTRQSKSARGTRL